MQKQLNPSTITGLPLNKKKKFFRPPTMRMLGSPSSHQYVRLNHKKPAPEKFFLTSRKRLGVWGNRNPQRVLVPFARTKGTRRQAKPDHLMRHEKKEIAPPRNTRKRAASFARGCRNHSMGGREPDGPPLRKPRRVGGIPPRVMGIHSAPATRGIPSCS